MRHWKVRRISDSEYHVVETRFQGEGEFLLAKCSGPVPAGDIVKGMFLSQHLERDESTLHNLIFAMQDNLKRFKCWVTESRNEYLEGPGAATVPFGSYKDDRLDNLSDVALVEVARELQRSPPEYYRCFRPAFDAFILQKGSIGSSPIIKEST